MKSLYKQKLFIAFNRSMNKAKKQNIYPADKLTERIKKAFSILQSLDYYKEEKQTYRPTAHFCGCKDWEFHNSSKRGYNGPCKHMIAETLLSRIQQIEFKQLDFFNLC